MRTIITRGFIGRLELCAMALFVAANLNAAITDADLAKVTQFIQEGKTSRAKAEITILLDDNPNDPNASKLRKLLDSLGSVPGSGVSERTTSEDSAQSKPPNSGEAKASFNETVEWIKKNSDFFKVSTSTSVRGPDGSSEDFRFRCVGIETLSTTITLTFAEQFRSAERSPGFSSHEYRSALLEYTIPLQDLYADVAVGDERTIGQLYNTIAVKVTPLDLVSKNRSITIRRWSAEMDTSTFQGKKSKNQLVNGKPSSSLPLGEDTLFFIEWYDMNKSQIETWKSTVPESATKTEAMVVLLDSSNSTRMQKALEHLIRLSGGGGKTPERRKEPF